MEWGISVRRPNAPTQPLAIWLCPTNKAWICTCYLFTEICAISFACLMEGWWRNACSCSVCWTVGKRYEKLKQESNEVTVVRMGRKEASLLSKCEPSSRDAQLFSLQPFPLHSRLSKWIIFIFKVPITDKFSPTSHTLSELPSCCIQDWNKLLLRTWSWKTVMLRLTCFATSQHISLMFAGSNLLHHNLLTESVNASLGDKWNCFWGMHFICNFPMKNMTLSAFCIKQFLPVRNMGDIFQWFSTCVGL